MDYPSFVDGPKSWRIPSSSDYNFRESYGVKPILVNGMFVCGFHCSYDGDNCLFAISIFSTSYDGHIRSSPQVVWSANRGYPVQSQAQLQLPHDGQFTLTDAYNFPVWHADNVDTSSSRLKLSAEGNLMLLNKASDMDWQSFDYPTDSLVLGQSLWPFQALTVTVSLPNSSRVSYGESTASMDPYYVSPILSDADLEFQKGKFGNFSVSVAVKHLVGFGAVNKSFVAEVQAIGSIHHFNLVSLVGFCAEKFNRLLVYKYMANGSLDRWIFNKNQESALRWHIRKKIIIDIAKGLAYLHEGCNQKIIHLDIKPQNILLDENFNARVSDFGLSKLIGREQSRVVTTMRGTPGYMAPEWLSSIITEKADVYSFGIVVLEILCGRRNVDESQQEDMHLLRLFRRKQEGGRLLDLVDRCSDDMQSNATEVVEVMKVAAWCLQNEYARRPSMSAVVKLFEDSNDVVMNMDMEEMFKDDIDEDGIYISKVALKVR
ncbi:hypothetical protein GOBAR_DD37024 [Gossypium barbadense]|nr:hypothetical protein GOBAR_DD37024 [Gossypium barbadense]